MESDRGAVLTLRAASRGVIDFSKARVLDVSWWRRANALIRAMDSEDDLVAIRAAFDFQRSLVGNSGLTEQSFKDCQKSAKALLGELLNALHPWLAKARPDEISGLVEKYKKLVGDPADPEFRKKLDHDLALLDAADAEQAPAETEDQRIDRLIAERDARNAEAKRPRVAY